MARDSGETDGVPIKDYIDERFRALEQLVNEKVQAHKDAVDIELDELDRFRVQINTMNERITPREVYEEKHSKLEDRVSKLETWKSTIAGRTAVIMIIVGMFVGVLGAFIGHLLPT